MVDNGKWFAFNNACRSPLYDKPSWFPGDHLAQNYSNNYIAQHYSNSIAQNYCNSIAQRYSNSIANALEVLQFCAKSSINCTSACWVHPGKVSQHNIGVCFHGSLYRVPSPARPGLWSGGTSPTHNWRQNPHAISWLPDSPATASWPSGLGGAVSMNWGETRPMAFTFRWKKHELRRDHANGADI